MYIYFNNVYRFNFSVQQDSDHGSSGTSLTTLTVVPTLITTNKGSTPKSDEDV